MIGQELTATGRLIDNKELMLVHIKLANAQSVPPHDHKGQEVYFTPIAGELEVTLGADETHLLTPGTVLHFPGEHTVSVYARCDSEFFVFLINRC